MNLILLLSSLLGLTSVAMAAYIDHALTLTVSAKMLGSLQTALRYHQLYSPLTFVIGLICPLQHNKKIRAWLVFSAYLFLVGVICFSFSIYIAAITNTKTILFAAPIGGTLLMLGWCGLIRTAALKYE